MKAILPFFKAATAAFFIAMPFFSMAQPGISEFRQATGEITQMYFSMSDLVLVLGAICGLIGGLRVFNNWQFGKHHIDSQVAGWLFACIFLSLLSAVLSAIFGIR